MGGWLVRCCFYAIIVSLVRCDGGKFYLGYMNRNNVSVLLNSTPPNTVDLNWVAKGFYNNSVNITGWDELEVTTNPDIDDYQQAYYAGWVEGYLTHQQIYYHWYNTQKFMCKDIPKTCSKIKNYLVVNLAWIKSRLEKDTSDPYWYQVSLYYRQVEGLHEGYMNATTNISQRLTFEDLLWVNYVTDLMTLVESLEDKDEVKKISPTGHCSVLIKLLPGFSDVYFGHNSWITYNFMNRILKRYHLSFHWTKDSIKLIPGQKMAFSSYAGVITSIDDFYIINSGLVATETTNNVYNMDIYQHNKPRGQVLESVRSMVANRLATDTKSWSHYFSQMNSGTYNNQWMIIDLNKFRPGFEPQMGFLQVIEQMPGMIVSKDQTGHILATSYWASYNVPFYKQIYDYASYDMKEKKFGSFFSYKDNPRAKIFQREHDTVVDLKSMIRIMRYNHYKTDPYAICEGCTPEQNACNAVASRCDLNPINGTYPIKDLSFNLLGAIDAKIGSFSMFEKGEMVAIGGPTRSDDLPAFKWSTAQKEMPHLGQPDMWDFEPITVSWLQPYIQADLYI